MEPHQRDGGEWAADRSALRGHQHLRVFYRFFVKNQENIKSATKKTFCASCAESCCWADSGSSTLAQRTVGRASTSQKQRGWRRDCGPSAASGRWRAGCRPTTNPAVKPQLSSGFSSLQPGGEFLGHQRSQSASPRGTRQRSRTAVPLVFSARCGYFLLARKISRGRQFYR